MIQLLFECKVNWDIGSCQQAVGPIKIAQIGVRIDTNQDYLGQPEPRLAILIDGEARSGFFLTS